MLNLIRNRQKDNVSNQREHIVHLLSNEQSLLGLGVPEEIEPVSLMFIWLR